LIGGVDDPAYGGKVVGFLRPAQGLRQIQAPLFFISIKHYID